MTFLPIVAREWRVAARRPGTFRIRLGVALSGILIVGCVLIGSFGAPSHQIGRHIFYGLSGLCLLYCLGAGRIWTADCLSEENREGTLGLLFLTDLRGHDVVLGKLAATSLGGFYGLMAVVPVLAVPILLGGVTNAEYWRVVLVLLNTFLLSLAIGICASAFSRDSRRAAAANFFLLLLICGLPPLGAGLLTWFSGLGFVPELMFSCPVYGYYLCSDAQYAIAADQFWWSVGVVQGLAWFLVVVASWIAPRSWQDRPAQSSKSDWRVRWRGVWRRWSYGRADRQEPFRRALLDVNAFYWLSARARLKPVHVWTFLGCMCLWWLVGWMTEGDLWFDETVAATAALLVNSTLKLWVAIEAGHQLAEDRKTGTLEFLLSTTLTVQDILRGQMLALRRQFFKPLWLAIALELLLLVSLKPQPHGRPRVVVMWLAGIVMLLADLVAISFVAMWRALAARSEQRAIGLTILTVLLSPWLVGGAVTGIAVIWAMLPSGTGWEPNWKYYVGLWFALGLCADLLFGIIAWKRLHRNFHQLALGASASPSASPSLGALASPPPSLLADTNAPSGRATKTPPLVGSQPYKSRLRRFVRTRPRLVIGSGLFLLIIVAALVFWKSRPNYPPALVVTLSSTNLPLRVSDTWNGLWMILPDGSLWRWGQPGGAGTRAVIPEQVGTNRDWSQIAVSGTRCVSLRMDGTVEEWGGYPSSNWALVDRGRRWVGVAAGSSHSVALRRDGTLWAWGDNSMSQLGIGATPTLYSPNFGIYPPSFPSSVVQSPVQVGTDSNWVAVACDHNLSTLALRKDGTLWVWGTIYTYPAGQPSANNPPAQFRFPSPIRACQETNWAGIADGWQAWTSTGELWNLNFARTAPAGHLPAAAIYRLVATNFVPGHMATAFCGKPKLYEVRPNGSLWETDLPLWPTTSSPSPKWRQVGKRTDWISIWGGGTALGLTSDGTLWTWGIDPSREPELGFLDKLTAIRFRLNQAMGGTLGAGVGLPQVPAIQKQPRPLLRLAPAQPQP